MNSIRWRFAWLFRKVLAGRNHLLCMFIEIPRLKTWIARWRYHRIIDIGNPRKLNEKILWIEYNTDSSLRSRLTDKYEVRKYVAEKGYADFLVPLYGIYTSPSEIDFCSLPDQFVLKATHGCDMNYICRNKSEESVPDIRRKMKLWINTGIAYIALEIHYLTIPRRIICEEYIDNGDIPLIDYKIHCSDGKPRFILVCSYKNRQKFLDVFDLEWKHLHVVVGANENPDTPARPENLEDICGMAECLAEGIPFVRIDLYAANDKIYFGEMTFTPATGLLFHFTDAFLLEQGKYCTIPSS